MSVHLDRSHPLAVSHMLKRATTRIGRVYIVVRRNVQVPRSLRSNLQRGLVFQLRLQDAVVRFNSFALKKLPRFPEAPDIWRGIWSRCRRR
jgi:hypothetical protein